MPPGKTTRGHRAGGRATDPVWAEVMGPEFADVAEPDADDKDEAEFDEDVGARSNYADMTVEELEIALQFGRM